MRAGYTLLILCTATAFATACSIVNAPDDPIPFETNASSSATGGQGGEGGAVGTGGEGGMPPVCGDGVAEGTEECDDGMETDQCDLDCTVAVCQDGVVNRAAGEQCDDGNADVGDACGLDCRATPFVIDGNIGPEADLFGQIVHMPGVGVTPVNGEEQFVVSWSRPTTTNNVEVVRAMVTADAEVQGTMPVSTTTFPQSLSMATNNDGRSLVAWRTDLAPGTLQYRFLDVGGTPAGVGDFTMPGAIPQGQPTAASGPDGGFCLLWIHDIDNSGRTRCFNDEGTLIGSESTLEPMMPGLFTPHMLFGFKGGYIAGYLSTGLARGQVLDTDGSQIGGPFSLWSVSGTTRFGNGVGNAANSSFLVASVVDDLFGQANMQSRAFTVAFSSPGNAVGGEQLLGSQHLEEISPRLVRRTSGGDIVVAWSRVVSSGECEVVMRRLDGTGQPLTPAVVAFAPGPDQCAVSMRSAVNSSGDVMLVFTQASQMTIGQIKGMIFRRMLE